MAISAASRPPPLARRPGAGPRVQCFPSSFVSIAFVVVFSRLVSSNRAAKRRAYNAMMTRVVAGDSAHDCPLETAFGVRGVRHGDCGKRQNGGNIQDFHWDCPFWLHPSTRRSLLVAKLARVIAEGSRFCLGKHDKSKEPGVFPVQRLQARAA